MLTRPEVSFADVWLIYRSDEDPGMWVAHSLNTDQIGMGDCQIQAIASLKRVIRALLDEASRNPEIRVFCPAAKEIRNKLVGAKPFPQGLLDRAEELAARRAKTSRVRGKVLSSSVDLELIHQ